MAHPSTLDPGRAVLVVVDFQEAFERIIDRDEQVRNNIVNAVRGFAALEQPIVVTEQYPKGLGHTVKEILGVLPEGTPIIEKTAFSSLWRFPGNYSLIFGRWSIISGCWTGACENGLRCGKEAKVNCWKKFWVSATP